MSPNTWQALGFAPLPPEQAARLEAQGHALAGLKAPPMRLVDTLQARAEAIYPGSLYLQAEWLRAVKLVRRTHGGWLLDNPVQARRA